MRNRLFIGLDSGTQGTKAVVFDDASGMIIAESYKGYGLIENSRGGREQDPQVWLEACETVLKEVLANPAVDAAAVTAIGVSGQQHGCVALDKNNRVIRPAKLWCDTETISECAIITERAGGADAVHSCIGNQVAAGFTASKILWLKEHEPHNYEAVETVFLPHDFINFWLTGEKTSEYGDASGTAYFDIVNRRWSATMLESIDPAGKLHSCLPNLIEAHHPAGTIRPALAKQLGLPATTLISSGGGDNMMAAIGTGNVRQGILTASLGTSGTIYAHSDSPITDTNGELAAFCSSTGGWLPLICTMNVTVATELYRKLFNLRLEDFNQLAETVQPGADGLILLPYFNGERTPALPSATATLHGMTTINTTPAALCRAAMEGATFGLRYGLEVIEKCGISPQEIRLVGGGSKSPLWRQMVADIFNCEVVSLEHQEAGALGAALQALWCFSHHSGRAQDISLIAQKYVRIKEGSRLQPNPMNASTYNDIYQHYLDLGEALRSTYR